MLTLIPITLALAIAKKTLHFDSGVTRGRMLAASLRDANTNIVQLEKNTCSSDIARGRMRSRNA